MIRLTLATALLVLPTVAGAQTTSAGASASPPQRIRSVQLTAGQQCPKGEGDEIVVCSPAEEPYRIPKSLRDSGPIPAQNQSWVNRVADIDQTGRVAGGLPNTCSPIGNGGQTGCSVQAAKQWAAEKRAQRRAESSIP
jgi:hypothetical protein